MQITVPPPVVMPLFDAAAINKRIDAIEAKLAELSNALTTKSKCS